MKKLQTDETAAQQMKGGLYRKGILVLCLLLGIGIVVSLAFLGGSIGQFSGKDANVIPLVPPEYINLEAGEKNSSSDKPEKVPDKNSAVNSNNTSSENNSENTGDTGNKPEKVQGDLQVLDDGQTWSSETHVDLFRESYNDTVKSENGEKVIAPGTTNSYHFTVKNNGNIPMSYSISLKVDTHLGEDETYSELPLEWRLLSDDGAVVTDWKGYNERTETLKRDFLKVRNQDKYTIEWRWTFEGGGDMDAADTHMGNIAVNQDLGVDAAIYVYAEQCGGVDENLPGPQTGDSSHTGLYIALAVLSVLGFVVLFVIRRRGKNNKD